MFLRSLTFAVVDAVKSVIAIENVHAAIDQIAQTTLRKVVGQHTLDQALSETDTINADIRKILDVATLEWGVEVTLVELKDIQLPDSMKRAMARQAEAEREKRAKIIAAEGESLAAAALGEASDTMMAHPLALQLRNLQTLVELGVEKNTTIVFPAPLMSAIGELGAFLAREKSAALVAPTGHHKRGRHSTAPRQWRHFGLGMKANACESTIGTSVTTRTLEPELLHKMDAYWRAANYLSVGQIYLYDNPLLKRPLPAVGCETACGRPLGYHTGAELHLRTPEPGHQASTTWICSTSPAPAMAARLWSPTPTSRAPTATSIPTSARTSPG